MAEFYHDYQPFFVKSKGFFAYKAEAWGKPSDPKQKTFQYAFYHTEIFDFLIQLRDYAGGLQEYILYCEDAHPLFD